MHFASLRTGTMTVTKGGVSTSMRNSKAACVSRSQRALGCHAHGFAWAWSFSMPTQSGGHGTQMKRSSHAASTKRKQSCRPPTARHVRAGGEALGERVVDQETGSLGAETD